MPWVLERWTEEERAVEAALAPGRSRGASVAVTDRDRSATDLFLWIARHGVGERARRYWKVVGQGRLRLELHSGGTTAAIFTGKSPFGTYMGLSLASLLRYFLPEVVGNRSLTLVTSSDCNVPLRSGKTSLFLDMNDLLEAVNLKAWYANNPSDGLIDSVGEIARPHPKMAPTRRASATPPMGRPTAARHQQSARHVGLLLHEHARDAPEGVGVCGAARVRTSPQQRVSERAKRVFDHDRVLTDEAMRWRYGPNRRGLGETMSRVRRSPCLTSSQKMVSTAVIERPGAATSCGSCILGAILWSAPRARAGRTIASGRL